MEGAAKQRLHLLQGRGNAEVDSLFVETLAPLEALERLGSRDDLLAGVQRVVALKTVGRQGDALELHRRLFDMLPRGLAAVAERVASEWSLEQERVRVMPPLSLWKSPPGRGGDGAEGVMRLTQWLTRVQAWREVLGV